MFSKNQRQAALVATGVPREQIAREADVSHPTINRFANCESIHTSNEKKIIDVIRSYGWEMRDGGVLPVGEK